MSLRWSLMLAVVMGCSMRDAAEPASVVASVAAAPAQTEAAAAKRYVLREAELRLRAQNPRRVADRATKVAAAAGGFVIDSESRTVDGHTGAVALQLRVPEAKLDAVLAELRGLSEVLVEKVTGQDVTEEFVDVSAQLRAERALEARLLALLENTAALKDLLLVEQELARVRSSIEQKDGRVRYLEARTQMAAIHLVAEAPLQPFIAPSESLASRFVNAAHRSLELAFDVTEGLIAAIGFALPLLAFGLPFAVAFRRLRRRRMAVPAAGNV
jgi:Domain of unknown function (DUF4349)